MLRGELVYLETPDVADAETVRAWINDPAIHRWMMAGHVPVSTQDERRWYADAEKAREARTAFRFAVRANDDARLLGMTGLEHVDLLHGHGEAGLFIAPPSEWSKGFGGDALRVLLRFGFEELGLHVVRISAFARNERAVALYRWLGFTDTGRDREAWYFDGARHDLVRLDMLATEWHARQDA